MSAEWVVLLRGFLRGVLLFMFYKKFAAVVLSAVLVGVVPSVVFADVDGVSAVSDGDVEELSIEDDSRMMRILFLLLPVLWRIRRFLRFRGIRRRRLRLR
mgnify:CR=1 FL=1